MALRTSFPQAGEEYLGGKSDGWAYRTVFAGGTLEKSFQMIKKFLAEEGYENVPAPADLEELKLFRSQRRTRQMQLFEEPGYVHNPIKILFPAAGAEKRGSLILCVYNENFPQHLLRFHGLLK